MQTKKTFVVLAARWYKDRILVLVKGLVLVQSLRCRRALLGCAGRHGMGQPAPKRGWDPHIAVLATNGMGRDHNQKSVPRSAGLLAPEVAQSNE
jgi:hypothetical protein